MKIHQYNEMMRYLTRPAPDPSIQQQVARDFYQGGRVQYKPGGLVEPGVTHYGTTEAVAAAMTSREKETKELMKVRK